MKSGELKFRFSVIDTLMALEAGQDIEIPIEYAKVNIIKSVVQTIKDRKLFVSEKGRVNTTYVRREN